MEAPLTRVRWKVPVQLRVCECVRVTFVARLLCEHRLVAPARQTRTAYDKKRVLSCVNSAARSRR